MVNIGTRTRPRLIKLDNIEGFVSHNKQVKCWTTDGRVIPLSDKYMLTRVHEVLPTFILVRQKTPAILINPLHFPVNEWFVLTKNFGYFRDDKIEHEIMFSRLCYEAHIGTVLELAKNYPKFYW